MNLEDGFWQEESTPHIRRLLLDEAAGRHGGRVTFEFNMFDVTLDFDEGTARIESVLDDDVSEVLDLQTFLDRAASYGDGPALGDGLTKTQRHPPTFRVSRTGTAMPIEHDET